LMWAAAQSQADMVRFLASRGADVNARGVIRQWDRKVITEPRPKRQSDGISCEDCRSAATPEASRAKCP
jgi:ankyrin repeat protein